MAFQRPQGLAVLLAVARDARAARPAVRHAPAPRRAGPRPRRSGSSPSIAIVALVLFAFEVSPMPQGLLPTGAIGFWISAVGAIMLARAAFEISREPPRR